MSQVVETPQAGAKHLDYLDGWRGLAVFLVILGHFMPIAGIGVAKLGVELFFVLSGRLMAEILFVRKTPLRTFFPRRITRVYPALFIFVLVAGVWSQFVPGFEVGPKAVFSSLTFISNYVIVIPDLYRTGFYEHLWSLAVEEHSYLVLGLVVFVARYVRFSVFYVLFAIVTMAFLNGFISIYVFEMGYFSTYWRTDVHIASIFSAAAIHLWMQNRIVPQSGLLFWVLLAGGVILSSRLFDLPIRYSFATLCLAGAICVIDQSDSARRIFSSSILRKIGLLSFSLYLWQQPFIN